MPAPKPAKLLLLHGRGDGKDAAGRPVPTPPNFVREAPTPPSWLSQEARAEWKRVVPELERLDLLKPADRALLVVWVETWSRFVDAVRQYQRDGLTLLNPDSGRTARHPCIGIAETAASQLRTLASEFGLSPAAERRIGTITPAGDDDGDPFSG